MKKIKTAANTVEETAVNAANTVEETAVNAVNTIEETAVNAVNTIETIEVSAPVQEMVTISAEELAALRKAAAGCLSAAVIAYTRAQSVVDIMRANPGGVSKKTLAQQADELYTTKTGRPLSPCAGTWTVSECFKALSAIGFLRRDANGLYSLA